MIADLLDRTRVLAEMVLGEKLYFHRNDLSYRLVRRVRGEVGKESRRFRARRRRRERFLDHQRVVAKDPVTGKKKKLKRPKTYFGSRLRRR